MNAISTKTCKRVETKDLQGKKNGWILEIASELDGFTTKFKGQVYVSVVKPKTLKGFHKHNLKTNHLTCIAGRATLIAWYKKVFHEFNFGEDNFITIRIPPKIPIALYNRGKTDAYIINCCNPPYHANVLEQEDLELSWKPKK